ncbi:MAG TPA: threonine synthase [Spirochaetia bacterium]|nr:threonine synthase [Spirochaetia bacterium]
MRFRSTRNPSLDVGFEEAVFRGLAPDGGLYHPIDNPDLTELFRGLPLGIAFEEVAGRLVEALFPEMADPFAIAHRAFPFAPALSTLPTRVKSGDGPNAVGVQSKGKPSPESVSILELYHGPSCAFKDFGASFLATVMEGFLKARERRAVILTATSGDTGSAVAQAFYRKENIDVVVLYPSGRVSPLQEKQLTTLGDNIVALEVKGSFDDCQRMAKEAFVDPELSKRITLTSANSINLGRLLPQAFYYVWAWAQLRRRENLYFSVPSGNFGNLTAGVMAWRWGLPVSGFIAATNRNDVVPEYLKTGRFNPRPSVSTYSNAMDVGNPSNFERLLAIFAGDWKGMSAMIAEEVVTDDETLQTIREVYERTEAILDPHTAVGYLASQRFLADHAGAQVVSLSTAHPGKFVEVVEKTIGVRPELPPALSRLLELPKHSVVIDNTLGALSAFLLDHFA